MKIKIIKKLSLLVIFCTFYFQSGMHAEQRLKVAMLEEHLKGPKPQYKPASNVINDLQIIFNIIQEETQKLNRLYLNDQISNKEYLDGLNNLINQLNGLIKSFSNILNTNQNLAKDIYKFAEQLGKRIKEIIDRSESFQTISTQTSPTIQKSIYPTEIPKQRARILQSTEEPNPPLPKSITTTLKQEKAKYKKFFDNKLFRKNPTRIINEIKALSEKEQFELLNSMLQAFYLIPDSKRTLKILNITYPNSDRIRRLQKKLDGIYSTFDTILNQVEFGETLKSPDIEWKKPKSNPFWWKNYQSIPSPIERLKDIDKTNSTYNPRPITIEKPTSWQEKRKLLIPLY